MKRYNTLLYITLTLSVINLIGIVFLGTRKEKESTPSGFESSIAEVYTEGEIRAYTKDVKLPEEISFAEEKVPLQRIDVQESLKRELIVNTYLHSHTIQLLKKAPRFFAIIEPILQEEGIPNDFKYLAVIESTLDPKAISPVGAVGLWQFMEGTAKEYKLEVNKEVDERYNIEKSTYAAAAYLKKAYDVFGSWAMAAAAYNAGSAAIQKQIDIQNERNYYSLLLGEEPERYVFRILAMKQIMENPTLYHFDVQQPYPIEKTKKVKIKKSIDDLAAFAARHDISYKTLKRFNPWLRKNSLKVTAKDNYEILIPTDPKAYK